MIIWLILKKNSEKSDLDSLSNVQECKVGYYNDEIIKSLMKKYDKLDKKNNKNNKKNKKNKKKKKRKKRTRR